MNEAGRNELSAVQNIALVIKKALIGLDREQIVTLARRHLVQLRLIDHLGKWRARELGRLGDTLLCVDMDADEVLQFVDYVARSAEANAYLNHFLERASRKRFDRLQHKVQTEGESVIPSVVTYGLVLDRLTQAMREDWRIIEACWKVWQKARVAAGARKYLTSFELIKFLSVDVAMRRFLAYHKSGNVPPDFLRWILPANILEAMLEDLRLGKKDNAASAWPLVVNQPGILKHNPKTGAGPTRWSEDKKTILFSMPLPGKWADLYSTWNLAFISHYGDFPYLMMKLLIPQVNDYHKAPEEYLYHRVLALYIQMNYTALGRVDIASGICKAVDWSDAELVQLWSKTNRESAREYSEELKQLGIGWLPRWQSLLLGKFSTSGQAAFTGTSRSGQSGGSSGWPRIGP